MIQRIIYCLLFIISFEEFIWNKLWTFPGNMLLIQWLLIKGWDAERKEEKEDWEWENRGNCLWVWRWNYAENVFNTMTSFQNCSPSFFWHYVLFHRNFLFLFFLKFSLQVIRHSCHQQKTLEQLNCLIHHFLY